MKSLFISSTNTVKDAKDSYGVGTTISYTSVVDSAKSISMSTSSRLIEKPVDNGVTVGIAMFVILRWMKA